MTDERQLPAAYGALAIAFAAIVVYALSLGNGFAFDDVVLIPGDVRVTGGQIGAFFTTTYWKDASLALYRPLTSITFALDWYASQGNPAWFHFTNVIWHALASVAAYLLLLRFYAPGAALFGGLVFVLHPVHVEAVANVVGRGELIAATFFLLACLAWSTPQFAPLKRAALTALCYALAIFAKEGAVVLPAILVLIDLAQGERANGYLQRRWREHALLLTVFAAFMLVRWSIVGGIGPARLDPSIEVVSTTPQRLLTALQAWPINAKLLFFPRTLLADYGPRMLMPLETWTPLAVLGLTLIIATLLVGVVALVSGKGLWALALLWFPITILPVSNLIIPIGVLVAERTLYLPSLAICFLAAAIVTAASHTRTLTHSYTRALALAIVVALAARTVARIPDWRSTDSIMTALVHDRPDSFRAQWHMARMSRASGDTLGALTRYSVALNLWPHREGLVREAAAYAGTVGRHTWARDVARWGTRRFPDNVGFYRMLAAYSVDLGDTVAARRAVHDGLSVAPADSVLIQMARAFGSSDEAQ